MAVLRDSRPYSQFAFRVKIAGDDGTSTIAGFQEVSGLGTEIHIAEYRPGDSIEIGRRLGSRDISLWFADGSNYPGTANIRQQKKWFEQNLKECHVHLSPDQRMLVEYKPFEPALYHTDLADWGMSLLVARTAGPKAKVLVDTWHHYLAQNIEQIVAWLLSENMLGGFHFNDRRYADDDLTMGSIDPYQVFRNLSRDFVFRMGKRQARGHRIYDRSKPQPERQDRSHDPDGDNGAATVRKSGAR